MTGRSARLHGACAPPCSASRSAWRNSRRARPLPTRRLSTQNPLRDRRRRIMRPRSRATPPRWAPNWRSPRGAAHGAGALEQGGVWSGGQAIARKQQRRQRQVQADHQWLRRRRRRRKSGGQPASPHPCQPIAAKPTVSRPSATTGRDGASTMAAATRLDQTLPAQGAARSRLTRPRPQRRPPRKDGMQAPWR